MRKQMKIISAIIQHIKEVHPAILTFSLLWLSASFSLPIYGQDDPLLTILRAELQREFGELGEKEHPPYYMEFRVSDIHNVSMASALGCITDFAVHRNRLFSPDIRIGSYRFDNSHNVTGDFAMFSPGENINELPLDDHPDAVRYKIWEITNELYRTNLENYLNKLSDVEEADTTGTADFSEEPPQTYYEPPPGVDFTGFDAEAWKQRMNLYTSQFENMPEVMVCSGNLGFTTKRSWFLNTEGSEVVTNESLCSIYFLLLGRAGNDEMIPYTWSYYAFTPEELPSDEEILNDIKGVKDRIKKLAKAERAEPYSGPAILSAEATGVFFHEIFGHRIEGHRLDDELNSKTFKNKAEELVLDKNLSVWSDPTASEYEGNDLIGHYLYDDQGVKAQKVVNVEEGILKDFLMSRKPVEGLTGSNGHGRGTIGFRPVARQSNLFVEANKTVDEGSLRKKLIRECKKQDKTYGYYFKTVTGGFTNTMNYMPDFFNIFPLEVYRIYVDGRPDELVRGVNLIGTPLIMFSEILAAGDDYAVFSGMCGAESGPVPVSTVAPPLLVGKIETQNQFAFEPDWPILKDPSEEKENIER